MPAGAQVGLAPAQVAAPIPAEAAPAPDCSAAAAERIDLEARRSEVKTNIANVAMGRPQKRRKVGAGDVGRAAAGTAASLLLPFGVGFLLNAATGAAARSGRKQGPAEPQPDIAALIDQQQAIEARLREIAASPCATAPAPAAPAPAAPAPAATAPRE